MKYPSVFITGASRGIGEALADRYAAPGVTLGLLAQDRSEELDSVASRCRAKGARVFTYLVNVADQSAMRVAAQDFLSKAKSIDLVIANAGIALTEDETFLSSNVPQSNIEVNYLGLINTLIPFVPTMMNRKSGHLAAVSSIASFRSTQNSGAYSASKAAVNLWTEGLRLRVAASGVFVTTLCVGFVDTDMTKKNAFWMPGLISAPEAARLIDLAIIKRKRLVTLPWKANLLWSFFRALPGEWYDVLMTWAKSNIDRRLAEK